MKGYLIPHLPVSVTVNDDNSGTIESQLKEQLCDALHRSSPGYKHAAAQADALDSFILALACEGYDVSEQRFSRALQTSLYAIINHEE